MAAGIKEQIDDLDHLLDQLLKLPIDRVQAAPATILMKPRVTAIAEEAVEVEEGAPTLRFDGKKTEKKPVLALAEDEVAFEVVEEQDSIVETEANVQPEPSHSLSLSINEPLTPNPSPRGGEGSQDG
ncbi:MAG TPA: hypothetical protein PLN21_11595, partial [Gemmatales bacterium]|nr:hypothetical protein [Gemmatales bacterium]